MGRVTKDYVLEISAVTLGVGFILMILSYTLRFADAPSWLTFYSATLGSLPGGSGPDGIEGYNLWVMIISTLLVIGGGFYFGEQLVLRRRFERLISTAKKSEFVSNRRDLDELTPRLPSAYKQRVKEKEAAFRSMR